MEGEVLRDDQWERIKPFVPGGLKGKRGPRSNGRRFLDALLWMARSGGRWRDLPERFGPYQTAKRRYYRWIEMGVLDRVFEAVAAEPDLEWAMLDATVIRAHAQAAGARLKRGGQDAQVLGRSRGGFGTKLHVCVDAFGLPVRLALGPGQQNDMAAACEIIDGVAAEYLLADKAYDADKLFAKVIDQGGDPVVPPKRNRKRQHAYDKALYKERNRVERFFSRIKHCRRIATRYHKLAKTFMGFVKLACIMLWLK